MIFTGGLLCDKVSVARRLSKGYNDTKLLGNHKGIGRFRENREEDLMDGKTMTNEENYRFDVAGI